MKALIHHGAVKIYGQDRFAMSLSAISIHRNRSQHCHEAAAPSKVSFVCSWPLVTHFDGKLLSSVAGWPGMCQL